MSRKIRLLAALLILTVSIALLIWGFAPVRHETRVQPISPSELQLPTPESLHFDYVQRTLFPPEAAL